MNYQQLLEQVREFALTYYKSHPNDNLVYHNLQHTTAVAGHVTEIANHYQLNDRDFFAVSAAAWFHDLGYMEDLNHHEQESAKIAEAYLNSQKVDQADITLVKTCIMATQMPQQPASRLQEIICDADLYHLGTDEFSDINKLLRKEINVLHGVDLSKSQWRLKSIDFLSAHHYHTDYCQLLLNDGKARNLKTLQDKQAKWEQDNNEEVESEDGGAGKNKDKETTKEKEQANKLAPMTTSTQEVTEKIRKDKKEKPEKGIETMFRISSSNHQRLSDMADNKAHIMITVNSIILSAIISLLLRRLAEYEYLGIPTFILLAVSLLAMTFSILSTRPSIPDGVFTRQDVDDKKVNLLFFGNFYRMQLDDYNYGMQKLMEDKGFLYGSLIKDVYFQGVVLGRKYRLLRIAYNIFMFGLILSVVAFIIATIFFSNKHH
jgi:predicted metal-dependent HD superfamily phosphohydrolase